MKASVENPIYSVIFRTIWSGEVKEYDISNAVISIDFSEQEKEMAVRATIDLHDVGVESGIPLSTIISSSDKEDSLVFIKANDGSKKGEVFRGFVWDINKKESLTDSSFSIKVYDQLIYWQESDDSDFISAGRKTSGIIFRIAGRWGLVVQYDYENILHGQLVLRGKISDFITSDVLDVVKKQTNKDYVIRSEKASVWIRRTGTNKTVYTIESKKNAIDVRKYRTLNGVVTKVIILGTAGDDDKTPIEATIEGNTKQYGTLQKIYSKDEDTTLENAKLEAKNIIKENGSAKWEYDVKAVDIPWIRKGDLVKINTSQLIGEFIVKSISREISNRGKTMSLTCVYK